MKLRAANDTLLEVSVTLPPPAEDWIDQLEVAGMLGFSTTTASSWAKQGKLRVFEHGVVPCGRRKYSRSLVQRQIQRGWTQAVERQDEAAPALDCHEQT